MTSYSETYETQNFTQGKPTWGKNTATFSLKELFSSTRDTPNPFSEKKNVKLTNKIA